MASNQKRNTLFVACAAFFGLGLINAALGPVLPELSEQVHTSLADIGSIFTGVFLGALLAQMASGPLGDRFGQRLVLLGGLLLLAGGTLAFSLSPSLSLMLFLSFIAGLGHGAVDLGGNVLIARVFENRSVSALNLLNLFFGLGAFAGPALVSLAWTVTGSGMPVLWMGAALMGVLVFPLLRIIPSSDGLPIQAGHSSRPASSLYRSPLLWGLGLILLLYVGTENGIGGWTTTYLDRTTSIGTSNAALVTSAFWLALTAGRLVSAAVGRWLGSFSLLVISLTGAALGGLLLPLSTGSILLSVAAVLLTGFSFGSIYPTTIAITTGRFPGAPGKAASVAAAMGSVGGMLLPWLQGIVLVNVSLNANAWFVAATTLGMLLLALVIQARRNASQRRGQAASPLPRTNPGV